MRVYNLCVKLAEGLPDVDFEVLEFAALLHDIGGQKEIQDKTGKTDHALVGAEMAAPILKEFGFSAEKINNIQDCIISHRYKTENQHETIEAKILFDADKLDAIGAIGVARAFVWVGNNKAGYYFGGCIFCFNSNNNIFFFRIVFKDFLGKRKLVIKLE